MMTFKEYHDLRELATGPVTTATSASTTTGPGGEAEEAMAVQRMTKDIDDAKKSPPGSSKQQAALDRITQSQKALADKKIAGAEQEVQKLTAKQAGVSSPTTPSPYSNIA